MGKVKERRLGSRGSWSRSGGAFWENDFIRLPRFYFGTSPILSCFSHSGKLKIYVWGGEEGKEGAGGGCPP